jgi:PadR family transcriptional regulator PadR
LKPVLITNPKSRTAKVLASRAPCEYCQLLRGAHLSKPTDLVQGTLDLLILKVVALEPMHGWAIAQRIRQMSGEVLLVGQSALYPSLHKLEQNGWISSEWAISDNNRRAKYYTLTKAGRKALTLEAAQWERLAAAISSIVRAV